MSVRRRLASSIRYGGPITYCLSFPLWTKPPHALAVVFCIQCVFFVLITSLEHRSGIFMLDGHPAILAFRDRTTAILRKNY